MNTKKDNGDIIGEIISSFLKKGNLEIKKRNDLKLEPILITLEESYYGTEKIIKYLNKEEKIKIPAGIKDNQVLVIKAKDDIEQDVYIPIKVKSHNLYRRIQNNIKYEVHISSKTANFGGKVEVPFIDGTKKVYKIRKGTETGKIICIKNKGFRDIETNKRGDFIIKSIVDF